MDIADVATTHPGWFRLWVVASLVWVAEGTIAQWNELFPAAPVSTSGMTYPNMEFYRACKAWLGVLKPTQAQLAECVADLKSEAERMRA